MGVALRARRLEDVPPLLGILQRTHEAVGYPVRSAAVSAWWLASEHELGGWVAVNGDRVVGHVALHPAEGAALPLWQSATGREPGELAVVSRLFTDGTARGAGTLLLAHVVEQAHVMRRVPVLEVDPEGGAADFYRRRGWHAVGSVLEQWGHRTVDAIVMVHVGANA